MEFEEVTSLQIKLVDKKSKYYEIRDSLAFSYSELSEEDKRKKELLIAILEKEIESLEEELNNTTIE